ncbi:stage V sporulation protein B [Clostridium sp. MB40-C1]|uniref:stage V sporulation protein B n=1 Tax=Clostridium sp. MB40-C1 TaxID=3070996 RepID=UPI0027E2103A|nr:stage V sporulation protein B [Clostridium sp. MB40-C1]WMJ80893.1 stage V sporulation protein B [Clostridium sp. MB40-C1]
MKKDNFLKNSILLTISNSTTGVLKFVFSIILSRELGAEGMGLYALIMPIYDLFACLTCGGMMTALSKESSLYQGRDDYVSLHKSVHISLVFDFIWSLLIVIFVFMNSRYISINIIKDTRSLQSLIFICPALIFLSLSSIIKGYFYGTSRVNIPSIIDILEKTVRIAVTILAIRVLPHKEIQGTVSVVYGALSAGEFISFILLYIFYRLNKNKDIKISNTNFSKEGRAQLLFNILIMAVPLCVNGFLSTALSAISTLILPRRLLIAGFTHTTALEMIGKFSGMALTIIFFPLIIVTSMSIVLIPDLAETLEKKDYFNLESRIRDVLKISFLLGISTLIICFSIPNLLGKLFFAREDLTLYIKVAAICAPFSYTAATTFSILNGLGKQGVLLRNSIIMSIEEVILLYVLTSIPSINILGYGLSLTITSITSLIMNMYEIKKKLYINFSLEEIFIDILISLLVYFSLNIINFLIPNTFFKFKTVILIFMGFLLFFLLYFVINKTIKKESVY